MKDLLEAGVHFGHQTKRWNPKMKEFIFGERNGIYIIDLGKTVKRFTEAEEFVTTVLVDTLRVREVVVGFNHTFGRGARGTAALLRELGERYGFLAHVVPPLQVDGLTVSSSAIREALRDGDLARARAFLGHPYAVTGPVLRGAGRGRGRSVPSGPGPEPKDSPPAPSAGRRSARYG